MKRFIYPMLWSAVVSLLILSLFVFENRTHAESANSEHCRTQSLEGHPKKVTDGRGADFVRVIIQPANQADASIDSTLEDSGGSNIRKFKNFAVRVVTLPAQAAVNIANRQRCFIRFAEPRRAGPWAMFRAPPGRIRSGTAAPKQH